MSSAPFLDYGAVERSLDAVDLPSPIYDLFRQGLSLEPSERPQNASVLLALIETVQAERSSSWIKKVPLYLEVTDNAWRRLIQDFPGRSKGEIAATLAGDLNMCCGFASHSDETPGGSLQLSLYGASLSCHVAVHRDNSAQLVVLNVRRAPTSLLEQRRERALVQPVQVAFGLPESLEAAREALAALLEDVSQHEAELRLEREAQRERELFGRWGAILNLKGDIEKAREQPLTFSSISVDEHTAELHLRSDPDEDIIGQPRCIYRDDRLLLRGEVLSIDGRTLRLRVDFALSDEMPSSGSLVLDNAPAREALKRQKVALDDVRFDRALRSDLRQLLLDPKTSTKPIFRTDITFVQADLDDAKHDAVAKALGSTDFLLVQGPPGTGKTTFITETILQTLAREPKARILLTSQTHVALDNAVERLQKYVREFRIVRIGKSENSRISRTVEKLLIENQIGEWRNTVIARGREYLEAWATSHGISRRHYDIATLLRRICSCDELEIELREEIESAQSQILDLKSLLASSDNVSDAQSEILQLQDQLSKLKATRESQRKARQEAVTDLTRLEPDAIEILTNSAEELQSWADAYLPQTSASAKLQKLVETHTNWEVRLGRAADFESALIASSQVIAGTCVGIAAIRGLRDIEFDLCIVDEASKATPTETLVPMCRARRWIVVGDSKQLPPFIDEGAADATLLSNHGLKEEMLTKTIFDRLEEQLPRECITTLDIQHRMVPQIGKLVSDCFYEGRLKSAPQQWADVFKPQVPRPVVWITTSSLINRAEARAGTSYSNPAEARIIHDLLAKLDLLANQQRLSNWDVVILTSYGEQRQVIDRELAKLQLKCLRVECNTVDAVQGREAKVAIYSLTRSNPSKRLGFLKEKRRLNVALSRGQQYLIVVGDHVFARDAAGENPFSPVVSHIEQHPSDCAIREFKR